MFKQTFREKPISGGVPFSAQARLVKSDVLPNKDNTKYTALTHTKKGCETYNNAINKRGYIPISNVRETHLNKQFNLREFYQNGEQRNVVSRNLRLKGSMMPEDRQLLDDFQAGLLTQSLELDTVLGDSVRGGQNEFEELMELRQNIQSSLPPNMSRELRERILNQATDNYFKDFKRRNPETGNEINDPIQMLRDKASVNRFSIENREIDRIFRGDLNQGQGGASSRPDGTFADNEVFRTTQTVQTGQSIPRVRKEDEVRPFDAGDLTRGKQQLKLVKQDTKNIPKRLDEFLKTQKQLLRRIVDADVAEPFTTDTPNPTPQEIREEVRKPRQRLRKITVAEPSVISQPSQEQIQQELKKFEKLREEARKKPNKPKQRKPRNKQMEQSRQLRETMKMMEEDTKLKTKTGAFDRRTAEYKALVKRLEELDGRRR